MIRQYFIYTLLLCFPASAFAQDMPAYRIFSSGGKKVTYDKMIKSIRTADVVFFGELHDNPIAHWLELQVAESLYEHNSNLVLGLEMFEADDQIIIDEYLNDVIQEKHFLNEAKLWENYKTDYRPLIEFARTKKLPVAATNVPRRYANLVYRKGVSALDSLSLASLKWMAPLPLQVDFELSGYKSMMTNMGSHGVGNVKNLVSSQALKDATMAYFIHQRHQAGNIFFHVNGAYHSQDGEGIIWYLKRLNPDLRIATIHVAQQASLEALEENHEAKADFIICVPTDMTRTY